MSHPPRSAAQPQSDPAPSEQGPLSAAAEAAPAALRGRLTSLARARTALHVLLLAGAQALTQVASFVAVLLVARGLSLAEYGVYAVAITTSFFVAAIPGIGIDLAAMRVTSAQDGAGGARPLAAVGAAIKLVVALTVTALTFLLAGAIAGPVMGRPEASGALRVGAVAGLIAGSTTYVFAMLQARRRFTLLTAIITGGALLKVAPVALLALAGLLTLWSAYAAFLLSGAAVLVAGATVTGLHRMAVRGADRAAVRRLLRASAWLTLGILVNSVMVFMDVYIITALRGPEEAAVYSGARVIAMGLYVFGAAALAVMLPLAARMTDPRRLARFIRRSTAGMAALSAALLVLPLGAGLVVRLVLPAGYDGAVAPLRLLSLALLTDLLMTPAVVLLITLDATRLYALASVLVLPFAGVAAFAGVATAGADGAAAVYLGHRTAVMVLFFLFGVLALRRRIAAADAATARQGPEPRARPSGARGSGDAV
ncbi:MAG: oligosaccharide flippase family protein [Dehalococcoidia bacterium]